MVRQFLLVVSLLVLTASHATAEPSSGDSPRPPLSGFIAHGTYMVRVGETKKFFDPGQLNDPEVVDRGIFQAEIGGMGRVGEKWGTGLSFFLGGNRDLTVLGVKARVRRMVSTKAYLDVAPGFVGEVTTDGIFPESSGFVGEVTFMTHGWIGVTTQVQSARRTDATGQSSTELWWYVGPKIAGTPGIFAAAAAVLLVALLQIGPT